MDMRICSECGHEYDALQPHECYFDIADILRERAQHGGKRPGAGRPALDGGSVRVTVTLTPELVAKADELGGGNTSEGIRIALKGQGTMNSGLTDNAWVKRVDEIRQMVSDVDAVPVTEDDVKFYISQFGLETWDEVEFATKEFERQYGPMLTDKK